MANLNKEHVLMGLGMKDDPLQILMTIMKDVTGHIAVKLMMVVSILYIQLFNTVGFFAAYNDKRKEPLNYLTSFLIPQVAIYTTFVVIRDYTKIKMNRIQQHILENSFPLHVFGNETKIRVLKYCKNIKLLSIAFSVIIFQNLIVSCYCFYVNNPDINLISLSFATYFRELSSFFQHITFVSYFVVSYGCIILPVYVSYCAIHIQIQMVLLKANLARISHNVNDLKLIHDEKYQNFVRLILRQSVIHHLNIKRLSKKFVRTAPDAIIVNPLLGTFSITSVVYFIQMGIYPKADVGVCLFVITGFLIIFVYVRYGQLVEDEPIKMVLVINLINFDTSELRYLGYLVGASGLMVDPTGSLFTALTQCSWVVWNASNRRTLLLFLTNARPIKLSAYDVVDVNAVLVINIMSAGYKILLCFNQLFRNKSKL